MPVKGKVPKTAVLVEITLSDGSIMSGNLFMTNQSRLSDVLNDERKFLPVQTLEGKFVCLRKSVIQKVSEHNPNPGPAPYMGNNPWQILGVKEGITVDELKQAYYQLARIYHPDRVKALGLGSNYEEMATKDMARINDAYAEVLSKLSTDQPSL